MQTEKYWQGSNGDAYTERQTLSMDTRKHLLIRALAHREIKGLIEFGANDGSNLRACRAIAPAMTLAGVEINDAAYDRMQTVADFAFRGSMLDAHGVGKWDVSMTRGVLIHISPDSLNKAYEMLYESSIRYICITEYYSPTPRMIPYRGKDNLLWARDFAGEMMDLYPLKLVDYFFTYHRDPEYPQDDVTTFVMERK
jgi:pseudaminic acid biosynthesis-associated methylase